MTDRRLLLVVVIGATLLAAWLRIHGITAQVVQDDEWHAIGKLMTSGYGEILASFGLADHSIPLTLLYKAMAETLGLAEGRLRALQVACGIALVPAAAGLAWRASRDAAASALSAVLVAAAPLLVLYSRVARPYAITLLLTVAALAALWRWRRHRSRGLGAGIALACALSAWLHPVSAVFPAAACLFVFAEDLATAAPPDRARRALGSLLLGVAVAVAMLAPLVAPLAHDWGSLAAKAGRDQPGPETLVRMLSIFLGGLPPAAVAAVALVALGGAVSLWRSQPRLVLYLGAVSIVPVALVAAAGAHWSQQGHTFGRYVLPVQLVVLFFASLGAVRMARAAAGPGAAWAAAGVLAGAHLAATPAIAQVWGLGAWYAHVYHQYDYDDRFNAARAQYRGFEPPDFYRRLGAMAPGSAPIIEAPFSVAAPANAFAFFATFHRQPERIGLLHDLCLGGPRHGEPPPHDRRFRFRTFVALDDVDAVRRSGARYLVLYREQIHARPFREGDRCIAALTQLYGPPAEIDARAAVFDLAAPALRPKLQ